jgi:hypothetical protein
MIVDLNGKKFHVTFEYSSVERPASPENPLRVRHFPMTRCYIWKGDRLPPRDEKDPLKHLDLLVASGTAICNLDYDQFVKNKGRKFSLAKALKKAEFDKDARTKFWTTYKEVRHGKI